MRIAIYEPDPRVCGPDTWARHLRWGFREIGCDCDVVAFTKSGKRTTRWGRVVQNRGMSMSCPLDPDVVMRTARGGAAFDDYDLIVLTDVKCPTQDKSNWRKGEMWPPYVEVLAGTDTPWVSALHGKWYFEEDELPRGVNVERGSPYLPDLLDLPNFAGYLIEHAPDDQFVQHSARLRAIRREYLPLPYRLEVSDEVVEESIAAASSRICALGRVTKIKYRHLVNELAVRGRLPPGVTTVLYGGGSSCQTGPNESFQLYEHLVDTEGWSGQREGGSKSASPWVASKNGLTVEYYGMYGQASDVALGCSAHVGLTDTGFSGGLLEFSTLEAIDCGCVPIVNQAFVVPYLDQMIAEVVPYDMHGKHGVIGTPFQKFDLNRERNYDETREAWLDSLELKLKSAVSQHGCESVRQNRSVLAREHDPRKHAEAFIKGANL